MDDIDNTPHSFARTAWLAIMTRWMDAKKTIALNNTRTNFLKNDILVEDILHELFKFSFVGLKYRPLDTFF